MAAVKKKAVTAKLADGGNVYIDVNGNTAAHELAALNIMQDAGYTLSDWTLSDVVRESYDTDGYQIIFERVE